MSDNGKSFEFGYDNSSGDYGYYKEGVFTAFGGGGSVIPEYVFMYVGASSYSYTAGGVVEFIYSENIFRELEFGPALAIQGNIIDNEYMTANSQSTGNLTFKLTITLKQDCLYCTNNQSLPVQKQAGDTIITNQAASYSTMTSTNAYALVFRN